LPPQNLGGAAPQEGVNGTMSPVPTVSPLSEELSRTREVREVRRWTRVKGLQKVQRNRREVRQLRRRTHCQLPWLPQVPTWVPGKQTPAGPKLKPRPRSQSGLFKATTPCSCQAISPSSECREQAQHGEKFCGRSGVQKTRARARALSPPPDKRQKTRRERKCPHGHSARDPVLEHQG
jgi:hypothetical protein